jgi:FixJ family two-component response regulator
MTAQDWKTIQEEILILDDQVETCNYLQTLLQAHTQCQITVLSEVEVALKRIRKSNFCVVLTDFNMSKDPEGIELIQRIKKAKPKILVVLLTDTTDINIILQALRGGAYNFIRKPLNAYEILEVMEKVLAQSVAKRYEQRVLSFLEKEIRSFTLSNDVDLLNLLIQELNQDLVNIGICSESQLPNLALVLTEALANAIEHGNLELSSDLKKNGLGRDSEFAKLKALRLKESFYSQRKVYLRMELTQNEVRYYIRDEGKGFDYRNLPDPTQPDNLFKLYGRGLMLIRAIMDEVYFNVSGNEITLVKRRNTGDKPSSS